MENILEGLNEEQRCAVTSISPVVQVLAPPGSGKTKTLTARVAFLIRQGFHPCNMIVCTFTIKAAREMKERIKRFVGEEQQSKLVLGTFHSIARRYLTFYGHHIGIPKDFGIADERDVTSIITKLIKKGQYQLEPKVVRSRISKRKSNASSIVQQRNFNKSKSVEEQEFDHVFALYQEHLKRQNLLDFDDLLVSCVELLSKQPGCVSNIQAVLIDEFQDTNNIQYELMRLFSQHSRTKIVSITIVGDPDQSIYGWRNAEVGNLRKMQDEYKDHQTINLMDNYRSSSSILKAAMAVIEQDGSRHSKTMRATHCLGCKPTIKTLGDTKHEAKWIVGEIKRLMGFTAGLYKPSDFAILLRSVHLSASIEIELSTSGIPYTMVGNRKFFEKQEIKILIDYLRVVADTSNSEALSRIINVPGRKVGTVSCKQLVETADNQKTSLWKVIEDIVKGRKSSVQLSREAVKGIDQLYNVIWTAKERLMNLTLGDNLQTLAKFVIQKLSFESYVKKLYENEKKSTNEEGNHLEYIDEFLRLAAEVIIDESALEEALVKIDDISQQEIIIGPQEALQNFLANFALSTDTKKADGDESQQLVISTMHAAKGLEWPVVFIGCAYEGIIPHSRTEDVDEERRLLFVGMTRAQSLLYVSRPQRTRSYNESWSETRVCPFLDGEMKEYFNLQGPSMEIAKVEEIANILKRSCPDKQLLLEGFSNMNYAEDDISLCDQVIIRQGQDGNVDDGFYDNEIILRAQEVETIGGMRLNSKHFQGRPPTNLISKASTTTSFVRASLLPMDYQEEKKLDNMSKRSFESSKIENKAKVPVKKLKAGQSSLTKFGFGYGNTNNAFRSHTSPNSSLNLNSMSNSVSNSVSNPISNSKIGFRTASSIFPTVNVSARKIRTLPSLASTSGDKAKQEDNDVEERRKHILLSSSPPNDAEVSKTTTNYFHVTSEENYKENNNTSKINVKRVYRLGTSRR